MNRAAPAQRRTRLSPARRRGEILDTAARIVLGEGLSAVGMERVARDAGVSKALVYNYFPTRDALLTALLDRAQAELRDRGMVSAMEAPNFEELIRQTTRLYLEQTRDRGALIAALLSDPSVSGRIAEESRAERERTVRFFVRATRRAFGLSLPAAIAAVDLLWSVTDQAGRRVAGGDLDVETATEMCVALILGGLERFARARAGGETDDGSAC